MINTRLRSYLVFAVCACLLTFSTALAQRDSERKTVAITYPLDETVTVKFRGTTLLPRLKGEAKVRRAGRRGTRVELNIDDLPRASELGGGGIYTTYVLWAISPDGHVDNLGEIKRRRQFVCRFKARRYYAAANVRLNSYGRATLPNESPEPHGGDGKLAAAATKRQRG